MSYGFQYRRSAARWRFFGYIFFLGLAILTVAVGYSSNLLNPTFLIIVGLVSLYLSKRFLKRSVELSADFITVSQTVRTPNVTLSVAYEIPPELNRSTVTTRIFNAAQEALDHHISEDKSTKRDDLKRVIHEAVHDIIAVEFGTKEFSIRIPSIEIKKAEPQRGGDIYV